MVAVTTGRLVKPTFFEVNNPVPVLPRPTCARLSGIDWKSVAPVAPQLLATLERVLAGEPAERELDALLRRHRTATSPQRRALAESTFNVALWRRRLAWFVGDDAPDALWFALLAGTGLPAGEATQLARLPAAPTLREGEPDTLAHRWSTPDWLAALALRELGTDAEPFLESLSLPGPVTLRAHALLTSREALAQQLSAEGRSTQPCLHAPHGLHVTSLRPNLYGLTAHRESLFEVQDEGSQLLGELVEARKGDSVLDLCAGAGGKTLQLAASVGPTGRVHAFDVDGERLDRLQRRAERARIHHVRIHCGSLPANLRVDRALVDAPCSEVGALRRGPDARFRMDPASFERWPPLQLQLLEQGLRHLRPGGRLVYATCTLRHEENEAVAEAFEARHPQLRRVLPDWAAPFAHHGCFRALPHRHGTDGFFAAAWDAPHSP
ncbi:MAG: RsmB/NOP family class I SAM-dependent RNA methyltransferase [Deltaproteobacteria bacterium]|nr:RsmB/NOP family class I SAM-dependent RNA methyltransferase [Deltaproteobacteria bacterium]